jgi:hypothetical protein
MDYGNTHESSGTLRRRIQYLPASGECSEKIGMPNFVGRLADLAEHGVFSKNQRPAQRHALRAMK